MAEHYAGNRHKGVMFKTFAEKVVELLDGLESLEPEYAPMLDSGLVLDAWAERDRINARHGQMKIASRLVTPWEEEK